MQSPYGQRLIQLGLLLFAVALLLGLAIPRFSVPRLALSAHLIGVLQAIFLMLIGLLWPRLSFGRGTARVTFWLLLYGCLAAWAANLAAAALGAGNTMLPMAAGAARGNAAQELLLMLTLRSAALALIAAVVLLLWAARRAATA